MLEKLEKLIGFALHLLLLLRLQNSNVEIIGSQIKIRRGVRSGAQLSCTETRFQKSSQSGKNGFKHPMLLISMAYNVNSCKKKIERNTQKIKIALRVVKMVLNTQSYQYLWLTI